MLTLCRDNTFGSSTLHKKVLAQSILAEVVTGSTSQIAAKTKEYEFNLCDYRNTTFHLHKYIMLDRPDHYFNKRAGGTRLHNR